MRVGVEVGGTFTDLVAFHDGNLIISKVPSTPSAPDIGVFAALADASIDIAAVEDLGHGSTVATNAILERKGAKVAFVTTAGFRDILMLQRHDRRSIYDLQYRKPKPLVERADCFEAAERVLADGRVEQALEAELFAGRLAPTLITGGYKAVAICFLNSYVNPSHEVALAGALQDLIPGLQITCSSAITREFREYERASTTVLSAYVQPVIDSYLDRIEHTLEEFRFCGAFTVMQSNGGRLPAKAMRSTAITALFSGPAAGVVGAIKQAGRSGYGDLITFDMGGTSTDVCLVERGKPALTYETEINGLPVQTPILDIVTVGGGGGSIIWIDEGGMLRVGPQSAGADPGPACYGHGGKAPTVTDAQVVRGAIRPEAFLGGRMRLDADAAREAMRTVAAKVGMSVEELANSAIRLVTANIVRAIQLVTTERGRDPRDYVLVPFGGAGPLHAADIAMELGVDSVMVPPNPGVLSAYGLLASDYGKFASATNRMLLHDGATAGRRQCEALRDELVADFRTMGIPGVPVLSYSLEMRFVGQAFEVQVPLGGTLDGLEPSVLRTAFEAAHERAFHHGAGSNRPAEIVAFRAAGVIRARAVPLLTFPAPAGEVEARYPFFDAGWMQCLHLTGAVLRKGSPLNGLCIIGGATSTTLLPEGWSATLDGNDNLIMKRRA